MNDIQNHPEENRRPRRSRKRKHISTLQKVLCVILPVGLIFMSLLLVSCNKDDGKTPETSASAEVQELQAQVEDLTAKNIKLTKRIVELMTQASQNNTEVYKTVIRAQSALITGDTETLNECIAYLQENESSLPLEVKEALAIILEYKE